MLLFRTRIHACVTGVVGCALAVAILGFGVLNWYELTSTGFLRAEALACADRFATQPDAVEAWKKFNDLYQYQQKEELVRFVGREGRPAMQGSAPDVLNGCLALLKAHPPSVGAPRTG